MHIPKLDTVYVRTKTQTLQINRFLGHGLSRLLLAYPGRVTHVEIIQIDQIILPITASLALLFAFIFSVRANRGYPKDFPKHSTSPF